LYGGAAGGGKSEALLYGALQYVDVPGYSAILFRKTYNDLNLPGALMDRAYEYLGGSPAHWSSQTHTWTFPSGAKLAFGYLEREKDKFRYQSAEFQYVGFDELTQFLEPQYRFLFSRMRRLADSNIPLRMRSASNPGNIGHDWVKRRFNIQKFEYTVHQGRTFIPAKLEENPSLDRESYIESLNELDPITRKQYLKGDWTARHGGSIFRREWFQIIREPPVKCQLVRFWDKAATEAKLGKDPDYTVGVLLGEHNGVYYVVDVQRVRRPPPDVEKLIRQTAELDGRAVPIWMKQEPGSSGVESISHYSRNVLNGFIFRGIKTTGSKSERAAPVSSAAEAGNVKLVYGTWINDWLDEFEAFPLGSHDDQVDATSGAFEKLRKPKGFWFKG